MDDKGAAPKLKWYAEALLMSALTRYSAAALSAADAVHVTAAALVAVTAPVAASAVAISIAPAVEAAARLALLLLLLMQQQHHATHPDPIKPPLLFPHSLSPTNHITARYLKHGQQ
jgi:hypothetical protein